MASLMHNQLGLLSELFTAIFNSALKYRVACMQIFMILKILIADELFITIPALVPSRLEMRKLYMSSEGVFGQIRAIAICIRAVQ